MKKVSNMMKCPCCNNYSPFRLRKKTTDYYQCTNCKTLFSAPLDNDNMVGGGNEIERNTEQNKGRIERFKSMFHSMKIENVNVLDFGCGHGYLIQDLLKEGFNATGYDAYSPEFDRLPIKDNFHLCSMVEVIEHLSYPFVELDCVHRSLVKGGMVYIETSFIDIAEEEGIELDEYFYIEPSVGHSTVFSHHGLDLIMAIKGFLPLQHINRNVRLYAKR